MFEKYPDIVGVEDLCKMLDIGKNTAYEILRDNHIVYKRIGKIYKIPKQCVINFLLSPVPEI